MIHQIKLGKRRLTVRVDDDGVVRGWSASPSGKLKIQDVQAAIDALDLPEAEDVDTDFVDPT